MDYVVTKHEFGRAVETHFIKMPESRDKGWYIAGISVSAFKHRMQKRHIKVVKLADGRYAAAAQPVDFYYRTDMRCDWDDNARIMKECGVPEKKLLEFHHDSLWAFYDHISYDHKRNKLKVEPKVIK